MQKYTQIKFHLRTLKTLDFWLKLKPSLKCFTLLHKISLRVIHRNSFLTDIMEKKC